MLNTKEYFNQLDATLAVEELDNETAQTISGGYEVFTLKNKTRYDITYVLDGKSFKHKPNESWVYTAYKGGIIKFDTDGRKDYVQNKSYNLSNGRTYEFQNNNSTPGNPYDIELYKVA